MDPEGMATFIYHLVLSWYLPQQLSPGYSNYCTSHAPLWHLSSGDGIIYLNRAETVAGKKAKILRPDKALCYRHVKLAFNTMNSWI
jgi:hypothetical protein